MDTTESSPISNRIAAYRDLDVYGRLNPDVNARRRRGATCKRSRSASPRPTQNTNESVVGGDRARVWTPCSAMCGRHS